VVELRSEAAVGQRELLDYAAGTLARYELPSEIHLVDQLPRTDSGKVDLGAVLEFVAGRPVGD
jgi:acyl-coenzyme A synthetase/AMP-(fatty) acid ligase